MRRKGVLAAALIGAALIAVYAWPPSASNDRGAAYRVEEIPLPPEMVPEVSAVAFSPSGRLVIKGELSDIC